MRKAEPGASQTLVLVERSCGVGIIGPNCRIIGGIDDSVRPYYEIFETTLRIEIQDDLAPTKHGELLPTNHNWIAILVCIGVY
jgi:hypothetical protein